MAGATRGAFAADDPGMDAAAGVYTAGVQLRDVSFDHPDAQRLIAEVQQEYVVRYGGQDSTPTDAVEFAAPRGIFVVGYLDVRAVACGGWRAHDGDEPDFRDGDAELKRMYVVPAARGLGLARRLLADLECRAAAAGKRRLVLETGTKQPEAIALYTSAGYGEIPKFGVFRCEPDSRCFAKELPVGPVPHRSDCCRCGASPARGRNCRTNHAPTPCESGRHSGSAGH